MIVWKGGESVLFIGRLGEALDISTDAGIYGLYHEWAYHISVLAYARRMHQLTSNVYHCGKF